MEGFSLFRLSRVDSCQSEGYSPFEIMLSVFSLDLVELYKSMTDISIVRRFNSNIRPSVYVLSPVCLVFMYLVLCDKGDYPMSVFPISGE